MTEIGWLLVGSMTVYLVASLLILAWDKWGAK